MAQESLTLRPRRWRSYELWMWSCFPRGFAKERSHVWALRPLHRHRLNTGLDAEDVEECNGPRVKNPSPSSDISNTATMTGRGGASSTTSHSTNDLYAFIFLLLQKEELLFCLIHRAVCSEICIHSTLQFVQESPHQMHIIYKVYTYQHTRKYKVKAYF